MSIRWLSLVSLVLLLIPVTLVAQNTPPVADAGPDKTAFVNGFAGLEGSAYDSDSNPIVEWLWTVEVSPPGSSPYITEPYIHDPMFTSDMGGDYILSLKVSDGMAWSEPDSVTVHVYALFPPVAIATADPASGPAPLTVQFDASESYAAGELHLVYDWVFGDASSPTNEISPIHTYELPGNYTAVLRIQDELGQTALATVDITVTQNHPPVADAGEDRSVYVGEFIMLEGSATDPDGDPIVSWAWSVVSHPPGSVPVLSETNIPQPYFRPDLVGDYVLSLVASDGVLESEPDSVIITAAENQPPVAIATANPTSGPAPLTVQFDGSQSYDPEGGTIIYGWNFGDGETSTEMSPSHEYLVQRTYVAILTIYDEFGDINRAEINITVTPPGDTPPGTDVVVQPVDGTTGTTPVTLTFENVTAGGMTELSTGGAGPPPPSGFMLIHPVTYFELTTTATYTGMIEVCVDYSTLSPNNENALKLCHMEEGQWVMLDCTIDTETNTVCADVSSLSPFAIFEPSAITLDIFPESCPNPFNMTGQNANDNGNSQAMAKKGGILPVALVGSSDFDVSEVDVSTILLEGIPPLKHSYEDVTRPVTGVEVCVCTDGGSIGPDGYPELIMKFSRETLAEVIGDVGDGEIVILTLTGTLLDGTPIEVSDCITIRNKLPNLPWMVNESEVQLGPAVPNPFNPTTRISYYLPEDDQVQLVVYDVSGRIVDRLVAGVQSSGEHVVEWDAGNLSSGVYFYRLITSENVLTRKMVLLK